jgi:predicted ribosome quality control (RQC) complex YloA/Tae2 family protein
MKEGITSLDLFFLVKELKDKVVGSKIQAIKQIDTTFLFELYKEERFFLKVILDKAIYITKVSQQAPETPPDFCMLLRKHLLGKSITNLKQHEFDRVIELEVNGNKVIFELFSTGNLILTDSSDIILGVFEQQVWKSRILKPRSIYKFPPTNVNPFKYDFFEFHKVLIQTKKEIVKTLATDFGLGGLYAEEICKRLEINKNKSVEQLNQQEIDKIFRFFEQLKSFKVNPMIVVDYKEKIDVVPFELTSYSDKENIQFKSFSGAVEAYFEGLEKIKQEKKEQTKIQKEQAKVERIQKSQVEQLKKLQEKEQLNRKIAQTIYERYQLFENILNGINQLKQQGKEWDEIKQIIKSQDTEESKVVKEISPEEAKVVVDVGIDVSLDFRKSVEENASYYFEEAKTAKQKIEGLEKVLGKIELKPVEAKPKVKKPTKKWYERYRWFFSSNNLLVIAGKNARNNETVVKRYTRPEDLVLHVDIHGSPFVVIINDQKLSALPPETIYEAAEFAATYSQAWDQKIASVPVYYVRPEQVVKEPGLPLGSFMIKGERKWLEKIKPRLSIGIKQEEVFKAKLIHGAVTAVKKQTPYLITIVPGDVAAEELAKEIKQQLLSKVPYEIQKATEEIELEAIKKIIPFGKGQLVR